MLNVKAAPCEKSKATVLTGKVHFDININFLDKLEKTNPHFLTWLLKFLQVRVGFSMELHSILEPLESVTRKTGIDF